MLVKQPNGKYIVTAENGRKLSKPLSKEDAEKRLAQVEYFKNKKA